MEAKTEKSCIELQEKPETKRKFSRRISLNRSIATAQSELNRHAEKLTKHRRLQLLYTVLLCVAIGVIWVSLIAPLVIGLLSRPSIANLTRPHVDTLESSLANNSEFLPSKCQQNDTNNRVSNYSISCPTGYVFNCTMCVPICGSWHPFGESYFVAYRVETSIVGLVNFLFSLSGLIILLKVPY